eukprot:5967534-Lingulodinium_polyedra.AAC.1
MLPTTARPIPRSLPRAARRKIACWPPPPPTKNPSRPRAGAPAGKCPNTTNTTLWPGRQTAR